MTNWVTRAFSKNSTPVVISEELLDEEVVILMQGNNVFGDRIYSYLKLSLRNLQRLKQASKNNEKFLPSEFGTVIAAGKGDPTPELHSEMAVTYGLVEVPRPAPPKVNFTQPSVWSSDDENDEDNEQPF